MASISKTPQGKWKATVRKANDRRRSKTFASIEEAHAWANDQETNDEDKPKPVTRRPKPIAA